MGMFDNIRCKYPLPWPEVQDDIWQTKDTEAQYLDQYEIREDGTLWHEASEIRVEKSADSVVGIKMFRDNKRWEQEQPTGEIEIHTSLESALEPGHAWYSVRFWFRDGVVKDAVFSKTEPKGGE